MRKYEDSVSSATSGLPVYEAEISVLLQDGVTAAPLFSDNGVTPLAQPVLTDGLGYFSFFVADGTYTLVVADPGGGNPRVFPRTEIYEDARNVSVPIGEAGVTLPSVGSRMGKLLGFDGAGLPIGVAASATDLATIAAIAPDIEAVADNAANITTVATNLTGANTIGTVAGNIANVNAVAGISGSITSVADNEENINTVADNVDMLAGLSDDIEALLPYVDDIEAVGAAYQAAINVLEAAPLRNAKPTATSRASTTTLAADPNLTVAIAANMAKRIRGRINYSAGATGDLKYRITGPASPTSIQINRRAIAPGDTAYSAVGADTAFHASDIVVAGAAGSGAVEFELVVYNGANAGTVAFEWAQNAFDAAATILKAGSELEYTALPVTVGHAFANNGIAKLGDYTGPVSSGGHNVITMQTAGILNSYIDTIVSGSSAEAQLFTGNYTVTIDGGTPTVVAGPGGSTWGYVSIFSNLTDGAHRVKIQGVALDSDITIRSFGVAPSVTRPSDIPNKYRLYDATNGYAANIAKDGAPDPNAVNYGSGDKRTAVMTSCSSFGPRFRATTTTVKMWFYNGSANSQHILLQDGVAIGTPFTTDGSGLFTLVTLATGLSGTHEYEIQPIHSGRQSYINAIFVDTLETLVNPVKALDAWYGDSNVEMQIGEDARTHASSLLARAKGRAAIRKGLGGQKVSTWGRDNTALVTSGLSQPAANILNMIAVNDYWLSTPLATLLADYTTMLANERAGNASAPIICLGIHDHYRPQNDGTPYSNAIRITYNNQIAAAVAARVTAGDSNVFYIDTSGWISATPGVNLRDNVHLNAAGWIAFESHLATALTGLGL